MGFIMRIMLGVTNFIVQIILGVKIRLDMWGWTHSPLSCVAYEVWLMHFDIFSYRSALILRIAKAQINFIASPKHDNIKVNKKSPWNVTTRFAVALNAWGVFTRRNIQDVFVKDFYVQLSTSVFCLYFMKCGCFDMYTITDTWFTQNHFCHERCSEATDLRLHTGCSFGTHLWTLEEWKRIRKMTSMSWCHVYLEC